MAEQRVRVSIDGHELELSNLDKVLYPETGFTKGEVIDYYVRVADVLLPHLADRPLTRIRYPNGVAEASFFEKNKPGGTPRWVRTQRLPVPGSASGRETLDFIVVDSVAALAWLANLAAIELHTPQWRLADGRAANPDLLVVDLDPGPASALRSAAWSRWPRSSDWSMTGWRRWPRHRAARACSCWPGST
jgi:bifunctional non-homologous end joining protein LigD